VNPTENKLMTVFDLDKNQHIAFLPMAGGPDVIKFDCGLKRIYVACSSGAISVFKMDDPDHYRKLEHFPVQKKVHSLAVDPETHRVYAPEQEADGKAVAHMIVYEAVINKQDVIRRCFEVNPFGNLSDNCIAAIDKLSRR